MSDTPDPSEPGAPSSGTPPSAGAPLPAEPLPIEPLPGEPLPGEGAPTVDGDSPPPTEPPPVPMEPAPRKRRGFGFWRLLIIIVAVLLLLYYPVGMIWISKVDDDPNYDPGAVDDGASYAVATAAGLIDREVDQNGWPANDPFFYPGAALDNMPNFQIGIIQALSRFAVDMTDQIGRTRGSSQADPDLDKAAGLLKYSPRVWIFDPSTSWAPTASSESQYRAARKALLAYNDKLANKQAVFERRADNLLSTLDRFAADLGSASAVLDIQIREHSGDFVDFHADDVFYNAKGKLYAYAMLFKALGKDFAKVIDEKDLKPAWDQTVASLMEGATLHPLVVINGKPDGLFLPNHLAVEGFYLLRARTQLREITNILAK
ncbi:MAG TPA: DUF2333 family protein [Candidatus Polarisedimenticolia bacterium]|nr:DUF2333 family protein [Candidatus Polarisedimenticolia bacterium]